MKLLDKIKNTFFEEEYVEVEEPEEKKPVLAKKIEPNSEVQSRQEAKEVLEEIASSKTEVLDNNDYSDNQLSKKENKLPYFEEEDFIDTTTVNEKREEPRKIYGDSPDKLYSSLNNSSSSSRYYSEPHKEKFQPTPIISPIYGVLDKNYRKEEVTLKQDRPASYVSRKNADLDSVRKKAYGDVKLDSITPVIHDSSFEEVETSSQSDDLLYDMTNDGNHPTVDKVTIADAEEYFNDLGLEYNVDYKDSGYEKATGRRTRSINEEVNQDEISNINSNDNMFDLIDSMYEGGDEE